MNLSAKSLYYLSGLVLVTFLVSVVTQYKFELLKDYNTDIGAVSVNSIEKKLNCMAMNIYREAGHEPFEGKVAVAQVTMNRVDHPDFPKDVCGVVHQKTIFMDKVVCQFSWYCEGHLKFRPVNPKAYEESYEVAKKVILEGFRLDSMRDALYYHADYVNPKWRHEKIGRIGNHIFYRSRNGKAT